MCIRVLVRTGLKAKHIHVGYTPGKCKEVVEYTQLKISIFKNYYEVKSQSDKHFPGLNVRQS